jgi:ABC-type transport system involved in cytochrome c biogenesis permease subunit
VRHEHTEELGLTNTKVTGLTNNEVLGLTDNERKALTLQNVHFSAIPLSLPLFTIFIIPGLN